MTETAGDGRYNDEKNSIPRPGVVSGFHRIILTSRAALDRLRTRRSAQ